MNEVQSMALHLLESLKPVLYWYIAAKQLRNSLIFSSTNRLIPHTINLPMSFEGISTNQNAHQSWVNLQLGRHMLLWQYRLPTNKASSSGGIFFSSYHPLLCFSSLWVPLVCQHFSVWLLGVSWVRGRTHASLAQAQQRLCLFVFFLRRRFGKNWGYNRVSR